MDLKETERRGVEWIYLPQNEGASKGIMSLGVQENASVIFIDAATIVFSRATINPRTSRPIARPDRQSGDSSMRSELHYTTAQLTQPYRQKC